MASISSSAGSGIESEYPERYDDNAENKLVSLLDLDFSRMCAGLTGSSGGTLNLECKSEAKSGFSKEWRYKLPVIEII